MPGNGQWRQTISRPVQTRVNERIRIREVRLIDENGEQVGIVPTFDALQMARERGLDLVEVAPNAMPPVCRLMDYGKYRYEQSRKERESRRHQHVIELKEVRIRPKIDDHDLETKGRQAAKFLNAGDKVKITVLFRGREMAHPDLGKALLDQLAEQLRPHGAVEQPPRMEGRTMTMFLAPLKSKASAADRDRERVRSSNSDKEGNSARGQAVDENENPQGGQEALQDHRDRQHSPHQGDEEPQPAQEGAASEAPV
jgi:translation initiation factor IF-3